MKTNKPVIIGHPKVTERAYRSSTSDEREEAVRFAEATVHNGLDPSDDISSKQLLRLKAQIERDFLVHLLTNKKGPIAEA
jgi:hypothetical protein